MGYIHPFPLFYHHHPQFDLCVKLSLSLYRAHCELTARRGPTKPRYLIDPTASSDYAYPTSLDLCATVLTLSLANNGVVAVNEDYVPPCSRCRFLLCGAHSRFVQSSFPCSPCLLGSCTVRESLTRYIRFTFAGYAVGSLALVADAFHMLK